MTTEENKQLVLRWRKEVWAGNKRNLSLIDEFYAPNCTVYETGTAHRGRDAFKQRLETYFSAFVIDSKTDFIVGEGDMVAIRDTMRFKHTGPFLGIAPTGKEATISTNDIYRIVDGKIVEQWVEGNMPALLQQLGILPMPAQAGS